MELPSQSPVDDEGRALRVSQAYRFRRPAMFDGPAVHNLIARCPPLDANSVYCNVVQCIRSPVRPPPPSPA